MCFGCPGHLQVVVVVVVIIITTIIIIIINAQNTW
jgi:hypothetical protein